MVNIYFIHRFPFNKEAFIRDEFEFFIASGFNVKYLEISHLLKKKNLRTSCSKELLEYVIFLANKKKFREFLIDNKENSIIVTDVGLLANSAWMYLAISKSGIPYVLFENAVLPSIKSNNNVKFNKVNILKIVRRFNYKKIYIKPIELFQYYKAILAIEPAEMIITSKIKLSSEKRVLKGNSTLMKYSMSLDYKVAQNVPNERLIDQAYAVFIDQYFIHHPDFITNHIVHSFTAKQYYDELNMFLASFSKQTGLKVVIASHPRRSEEQRKDFRPEFDLFYNKTAELIKNSKIVLLHFSTAVNFAIIFSKPFILLNSFLFQNSSIQKYLMMFSNYFDKDPVNMGSYDSGFVNDELYYINDEKYKDFFNSYIKHPQATNETFRDQLMLILRKNYNHVLH